MIESSPLKDGWDLEGQVEFLEARTDRLSASLDRTIYQLDDALAALRVIRDQTNIEPSEVARKALKEHD